MPLVTSTTRYEYMGAVLRDNQYECGGVLLAPDKFVTTAECAYDAFDFDTFGIPRTFGRTVVLDCLDLTPPLASSCDVHGVTDVIFHPQYDHYLGDAFGYDVAVVVLEQPSSIKVPQILTHWYFTDELYTDRPARSFGYGGTAQHLRYVDYEVVNMEVCEHELHFFPGLFKDSMLCAKNTVPGTGTSIFDDGGPLIVDCGGFRVDLVLGLSSHQTHATDYPDIFTKFHDSEIQTFLLDNIPIVGQFRRYPDRVDNIEDVCKKYNGASGTIFIREPIAVYLGDIIFSYEVDQELENVLEKWRTIIQPSMEIVGMDIEQGTDFCGMEQFVFEENQYINYIGIALEASNEMDGLIQTDICLYNDDTNLPSLGRILLNEQHLEELIATNNIGNVISHGIAAALGIGNSWQRFDLIQDPMEIENGEILNPDNFPKYFGHSALEHYLQLEYDDNNFIPLNNELPGANNLWNDKVMPGELMTIGWRTETPPISTVTIAALEDLGFHVDYEAADEYNPHDYGNLEPILILF